MPKILKLFYILTAFLALQPFPAQAQSPAPAPTFRLPLACTLGETCWVMNYPDVGPQGDKKQTDHTCLSRTYEDHKGTDFAVPDEATMKKGVDVLAARDGTVMRVRDSEPDRWPTKDDLEKTKAAKRECGNAVLIDHGDGWQTMYCHMKRASVVVQKNQAIKAGDKIGQVGLSGLTEFPHLHFGLIHKDKVVDPFTGEDVIKPCTLDSKKSLWDPSAKLVYEPLSFFDLGFDLKPPVLKELDKERVIRTALRHDADALVFHATILGARGGDIIDLVILAPDGKTFAKKTIIQENSRARQLYYLGRKVTGAAPLQTGLYVGKITVTRGDDQYARQATITIQ
jgi:murein DD-endopeptidase MepM/ murein hydrolase activator NlpD